MLTNIQLLSIIRSLSKYFLLVLKDVYSHVKVKNPSEFKWKIRSICDFLVNSHEKSKFELKLLEKKAGDPTLENYFSNKRPATPIFFSLLVYLY